VFSHSIPSVARVLPHFEYFFEQFLFGIGSWLLMKAFSTLLTSALLVAGCSQVIDQFYSKKNFDAQTFNADISECKERNSVDGAMVRECMKAKGYIVQLETK